MEKPPMHRSKSLPRRPSLRVPPAALGLASLSVFAAEGGSTLPEPTSATTLPEVRVQDAPPGGYRTESTSIGTRTDTPLRDVPQFLNIVPQSLIRSQSATTLQDALRNVPGISYAAAEGGTQANQVFFLRGFPLNQDIFIDAVRDLGEYNRDLFATESIEVLKGSSALMFGRGSTGGAINQTSMIADAQERREVALTVGSFDQKRATADFNFRTGESSAMRFVALVEDSGSFRYPQDVEKVGLAPSYWARVGRDTDVTLSYYFLKAEDVTDYGQPALYTAATGFIGFPLVSPRRYYGYENHDFASYETHIATARVEHRFSPSLTARNTLRWANYERQSESTIATLRATDANGAPVTRDTPLDRLVVTRNHDTGRTKDNDDTALVNQTEVTWRVATGGVGHTILGGLEIAREKLDRVNYQLDANPAQPGVQAPTSTTPYLDPDPTTQLAYTKVPNLHSRAEADTVALYLQDQLELSRQWKALLGVRYERYEADARTVAQAAGVNGAGPFSRTDTMVSGRAGLIWQPTRTQSYYASWGNSYNPSGELGVYGGTAQTNLNPNNVDLDPEKNQSYEVGAHWDLLPGLALRGAVFRTEKTNARMSDPGGITVLEGRRRVDGVELELSGAITPDWDVFAGIAFMEGEIVRGPVNVQGNTPLGVAEIAGSVWTVYRLPGGFEIGGGARGQTGTWLTDTNLAGSQIPGYVVWDLTAAYVQRNYEGRLNVYNVGDERYFIGGYNNSPNRVLPGAPLSASVTFRYSFR
jgi:catecholate siderophore receptor